VARDTMREMIPIGRLSFARDMKEAQWITVVERQQENKLPAKAERPS
jgi:hypothetical protein